MNISIKSNTANSSVKSFARSINMYRGFIFFLVLTSLYGFIVWRINVLSSAPPSQADIDSAIQSVPRPKISDSTVKKLQSLEDNSIRVQTLFNEARQNPFE